MGSRRRLLRPVALSVLLLASVLPRPADAAWHGPIEGVYGDTACPGLGCDSEKTVEEMKAYCRATNPDNHCNAFSGGGVDPGGVLKGGCFRACSPDTIISGLTLDPGSTWRAYYWQGGLAEAAAAVGGAGSGLALVLVLGLGLYVGGGALLNKSSRSGATGWELIPHRRQWAHLRALTLDGVAFCKGGFRRQPDVAQLRAPLAAGGSPSRREKESSVNRPKERKGRSKRRPRTEVAPGSSVSGQQGGPTPAADDGGAKGKLSGRWLQI
jgi:hypothetical protein